MPDTLFRRAKVLAAQRGQTMTSFVRSALEAKITSDESSAENKPWMEFAGKFTDTAESKKIMERMDAVVCAEGVAAFVPNAIDRAGLDAHGGVRPERHRPRWAQRT